MVCRKAYYITKHCTNKRSHSSTYNPLAQTAARAAVLGFVFNTAHSGPPVSRNYANNGRLGEGENSPGPSRTVKPSPTKAMD